MEFIYKKNVSHASLLKDSLKDLEHRSNALKLTEIRLGEKVMAC